MIGGTYDARTELFSLSFGDYYIPDIRLPEENRPFGR